MKRCTPASDRARQLGLGRSRATLWARCLHYLESLAEQEQKSGTLVRAAAVPEGTAQSAVLVRPAATAPDSHPGCLLRPSDREEAK